MALDQKVADAAQAETELKIQGREIVFFEDKIGADGAAHGSAPIGFQAVGVKPGALVIFGKERDDAIAYIVGIGLGEKAVESQRSFYIGLKGQLGLGLQANRGRKDPDFAFGLLHIAIERAPDVIIGKAVPAQAEVYGGRFHSVKNAYAFSHQGPVIDPVTVWADRESYFHVQGEVEKRIFGICRQGSLR